MCKALDTRGDEKIRLEGIALQYKMQTMQRAFVAERAQIFSQYYQTVRDVREKHLDNLNDTVNQMHRERRQRLSVESEYTPMYDSKRSHQLARQTAYNKEVSLLSGIAKHKGFPAAPDLNGATDAEMESDLKKMKVSKAKPKLKLILKTRRKLKFGHFRSR